MNILVCVKQVPDTTEIKIDPVTNTLIRAGVPSIVNPFDAYALEMAVRLKEKAGGKITVSVIPWEMYVEIKVADTGKGISESNQAAIFRRFYREEEVHEQQGVGIGLYLTREIVTRQGGYIKVVSEPGKGSEFSIMLPTK